MNWIELLENDPRVDLVGPVDAEVVDRWSREAGIQLPADYRDFVLRFGCGDVGDDEVYGFGVEPSGPPSLPFLVSDLGKDRPEGLLPVIAVGDGSWLALVLGGAGRPAGQVYRWLPWESEPRFVASSLGDYFMGRIGGPQR